MMKVTLLVLVIVAAIFSSVFAADFALHLESGTPVSGLATSADDSQCTYVHLAVAEGTVAVQIDVSTSETNYVDVTAGFNYAPSALESTSNGYLFGDNNVYLSNNKRYFLCTYNPLAVFGSYNPMPSVYTSSTGYCAAYVPDLHMGGDVFVCLSTYSTASTNVSVSVTAHNLTGMGVVADATTYDVPAAAGTTSAEQMVYVYKLWMPMNVTALSVTTTSSSTVIRTPGLWYNAYTTGNGLSMGSYAQGTWFFIVVIQSSSTAESFTFSTTQQCDGMMTYPVSNSVTGCFTPQNITTLAPVMANFTASGEYYALYRLWIPQTPSANMLYTVNVTVNTTDYSGYVYFSGWSNYGADSNVNPAGIFTDSRNSQSVYSVYNSAAAHFILPGTYVNILVESSSLSYNTPVSVAVYAEPLPVFVYGATNLTADNLEVTVASIAGLTSGAFFTTAMLNAEEGNAYNLTVTSTNTLVGLTVASTMGSVVATANIGYSSGSSFTLYLPYLSSGTYMITTIPYGSGSVSNTFSVVISDSPSSGESTSAASTASYSFLFMIVALLATLLF